MNKIYKGISHTVLIKGLSRYVLTATGANGAERPFVCQLNNNDTGRVYENDSLSWSEDSKIARFTFNAATTEGFDDGCMSIAIYDGVARSIIYAVKHYARVYDVKLPAIEQA